MFHKLTPFEKEYSYLRGSIITIDGPVGAGKTTLCSKLEEMFNENNMPAKYFDEYVNIDLLNLFLNDMKTNAYSFQLFMLNKRLELYREAYQNSRSGKISIIDRSLIGDECFVHMMNKRGFINEEQLSVYFKIRNEEIKFAPNYMFYLEIKPETALRRVLKRNRKGESGSYTLEYVKELIDNHEKIISKIEEDFPGQVIRIDWNHDQDIVNPEDLVKMTKF